MQKTNTAVMDIKNMIGKLTAKYYMAKGVIEIKDGDYIVQILIPPETKLRVLTGKVSAKK